MRFTCDPWHLIAVTAVWMGFIAARRWLSHTDSLPTFYFPFLVEDLPPTFRTRFIWLPRSLYIICLVAFSFAALDPALISKSSVQQADLKQFSTRGTALYLVLDRSGSMSRSVTTWSEAEGSQTLPKIELLKKFTTELILGSDNKTLNGHPDDLIGIVTFARTPALLVPLTPDHTAAVAAIKELQAVQNPDEDGTAIGAALYQTSQLIIASRTPHPEWGDFHIEKSTIILITDGFQGIHPDDTENRMRAMDIQEGAEFARKNGIKVYIVEIEPALRAEAYAPQLRLLQKAAETTGGKLFMTTAVEGLDAVFKQIDALERGELPSTRGTSHIEGRWKLFEGERLLIALLPLFLIIGLLAMLSAFILEQTLFRRDP
ncbi:MAG: VWA domain-containing protein [Chlamydiia bacterium]|nr:VWA domain-containing protein [Chlamydiia bacterium]